MNDYLFTGSIITRSPLAVSPPGHLGPDKRSRLPRMTLLTAAGPLEIVFLPGSTIRGGYRHACADVCLESEKPVTFERYLALKVGGVKGTAKVPRVELRKRKAYLEGEPMLSLFGAGASEIGWIHGRVDVAMALPSEPTEAMVLAGSRGDVTEDPILLDVLSETEQKKVFLGSEANRHRSQAAAQGKDAVRRIARATKAGEDITELDRELGEARQREEESARTQSEHLGSDVSLLLPLPGYEAIPTGTVLSHRMFFRGVSMEQMCLFVAGLARFAEDPRFGGRRAHGCGRVCVEYDVRRFEGGIPKSVGTIRIDADRWDEGESSLALAGEPGDWLANWTGASHAP